MLTTKENADLKAVPDPPPRNDHWQPIAHSALALEVTFAAAAKGWHLFDGQTSRSNDGLRMAVSWSVNGNGLKPPPEGATWALGITNSNIATGTNGRAAVYLYAGLDFTPRGAVVLSKRKVAEHRGGVNFAQRVKEALAWFAKETGPMRARWGKLERTPMHPHQADALLTEAGKLGILARSRTYDAMEAFAKSEKQTAATLLLCFGEESKRSPPLYQMEYLWKFTNLVTVHFKETKT